MQVNEAVSRPSSGKHNSTCPFCGGKQPQLLNYNTKDGAKKDEKALGKNLAFKGTITSDSVGNVYPLPGGGDDHKGWTVDADVLADIETYVKPTPHHLLPGNAAVAKSNVEEWTCASKGTIKQDIGYNIDGADNGIWLPHLPHIHWTSYQNAKKKIRFSDIYGKWSELNQFEQAWVGMVVMGDTKLQMHYTDHDDPYFHVDNTNSYDKEALKRCNLLGDLMKTFWSKKCPKEPKKKRFDPPYGVVQRLNLQSRYMRQRITGVPKNWKSWVSPLAQDYTAALKGGMTTASLGVTSRT